MRRLILLLFVLALYAPLARAQSCDLNATTGNFAAQLSAAQPGQTICLASGDYGNFSGVTKSSPGVTLRSASGVGASFNIQFRQTNPVAAWLIFDGVTITGGEIAGPTHDVTFKNSTFINKVNVWQGGGNNACSNCPAISNSNIVFDGNLFNMSANQSGANGYEGRLNFLGGDTSSGITVKNSRFTTGCADGVQFDGGGIGVTIGPGNEFYNLMQGSCGPHVDSIQFVASSHPGPTITGNYFHDTSTGIVAYDYSNDATITNNVFQRISQSWFDGGLTGKIEHNTFVDGSIQCNATHQNNLCTAIVRNNITNSVILALGGSPSVNDYNLCTGGGSCAGSHSLTGAASYVGGANPSTYAGFALTSGSRGKGAASDGTDIGINTSISSTGLPAPPTNLQVSVQ